MWKIKTAPWEILSWQPKRHQLLERVQVHQVHVSWEPEGAWEAAMSCRPLYTARGWDEMTTLCSPDKKIKPKERVTSLRTDIANLQIFMNTGWDIKKKNLTESVTRTLFSAACPENAGEALARPRQPLLCRGRGRPVGKWVLEGAAS